MYQRTRYGTTLHFQKVVQGSDAYPATEDGKGKAPPSVRRMWLMALRFYEAIRVVMPSLHAETSNKSTHRAPSVFAGKR
jgi:hypothetical protein